MTETLTFDEAVRRLEDSAAFVQTEAGKFTPPPGGHDLFSKVGIFLPKAPSQEHHDKGAEILYSAADYIGENPAPHRPLFKIFRGVATAITFTAAMVIPSSTYSDGVVSASSALGAMSDAASGASPSAPALR